MSHLIKFYVAFFTAVNDLLSQLRNPESNARWALGKFVNLLKILQRGILVVQRQKPKAWKSKGRQWGAAYVAFEIFFASVLIALSVSQFFGLLMKIEPAIRDNNLKLIIVIFVCSFLLAWSMGWSMKLVVNGRTSLRRYWPKLGKMQKLQACGTFGALYFLTIGLGTNFISQHI